MRARFWVTIGVAAIAVATGCKVELPATVGPTKADLGKATPKPSPKATATPEAEPSDEASTAPKTSPKPGGASEPPTLSSPIPSIEPFAFRKGHLRGRVLGQAGGAQPIGLAFVTIGSLSTFSANPKEDEVVEEDATNADRDNLSVAHDFDGPAGPGEPELATRILRQRPPSAKAEDKYVYLRPGEFFLEGIPEGEVTLTASFEDFTSASTKVRVFEGTVVEDLVLRLDVPEPFIPAPDGTTPAVVEWSKLEPSNGISVSVISKRTTDNSGQVFVETNVTYKPDPPDVAVTLKAPPGSPGTVIQAYEISYEYTTPNQQKDGKPPIVVGPILVPTPPLTVPPAQEIAFGPPIVIQVPIGSRTLNDVFGGGKDDQPGLVVATIEFKDGKGFPVPGKDLNPLKVSVPIRAL